jgi:hypothetical protein
MVEFSKEDYSSESAVLPIMIIITWTRSYNTNCYFPAIMMVGPSHDLSPSELFRRKSAAPGQAEPVSGNRY